DPSLIIDDCKAERKNCTDLSIERESVKCSEVPEMCTVYYWKPDLSLVEYGNRSIISMLKANDSLWSQLNTVSCDDDKKEWSLANENGTVLKHNAKLEIRCAVEEPEPWVK
ncbi:hypothetical protein PENTCL1PPCAC_1829, partial [Pristionchus entomophagus]